MGAIIDTLREFLIQVDEVVYSLVEKVYYLFQMLSEATIVNKTIIQDFTSKIYVLIGLIMLFRLAFSFINYIVNPDSLSDKQKGGGKLVTNIIVSMVLLVSIPTIFNEMYYVQHLIVKEGIIEKLVLGSYSDKIDDKVTPGQMLSVYAFTSFFSPNNVIAGCEDAFTIEKDSGMKKFSSSCEQKLNALAVSKGFFGNVKDDPKPGTEYKNAVEKFDLKKLSKGALVSLKFSVADSSYAVQEEYLFNYSYFISTFFGLALCFILLGFCLDLAIRVVKLAFLQIIAPVPIVLNISPGAKNNYLQNYGKEVLTTWASLFIRIATVSFAIYMIQLVNMHGVFSFVTGKSNDNIFVTIFLILGLLMFAKEFPKLLENMLGMKGTGSLTLNPIKKMNDGMLGGGLIGGFVAGFAGGGIGGAIRGGWSGINSKTLSDGTKKAAERNKQFRESRALTDRYGKSLTTFGGRMAARYNRATGANIGESGAVAREKIAIDRNIAMYDDEIKRLEEQKRVTEETIIEPRRRIDDLKAASDSIKSLEDRAVSQIENGIGNAGVRYLEMKAQVDILKKNGASAADIARAERDANDYKDNAGKYEYMNEALTNPNFDRTFRNNYETARQKNNFAGINIENMDANALHTTFGRTKGQIGDEQRAIAETERNIKQIDDQIKQQQAYKSDFDRQKRELAEREKIIKANQEAIK